MGSERAREIVETANWDAKNVCGMSVVPGEYETTMRKYNLSELHG